MTIIQPLRNKTKGNKKRERDDPPEKSSCNANTKTEDFTRERWRERKKERGEREAMHQLKYTFLWGVCVNGNVLRKVAQESVI